MRLHAVWQCQSLASTEHFSLSDGPDGYVLKGVSMLPLEDVPVEIRYEVDANQAWVTRRASVEISSAGGSRSMSVVVDGRSWSVNGSIVDALEGCEDIDLGWTPATNILPMRRLDLDVGDTATTRAAWLRFPELTWEPSEQTYTRLDEDHWRYQSGTADHEIFVTPDGLACRYGDVFWGSVERVG
ncbi:MAG: putative glycolipid-binding domain-containing protein [Actinomycetota bacterium]|nr:putative glycolipid-binding domain-containing protein [Actinomycetota bacterium]